jgi:hypothetical protein
VKGAVLSAFGLCVRLDFPLAALEGAGDAPGAPTLEARLAPFPAQDAAPGIEEVVWVTRFDGQDFAMRRLRDGSHRFVYGERACFHLSADVGVLRCAVADAADPGWQRLFLDTILWQCSLLRGFELLHASTVCWPAGAVAIVAMTGGGKTSLAAELLGRGATLVSDDVLALDRVDGRLGGHPGPPVMNVPRTGPAELGRELARFPDERWVALDRVAREPQPLAAICLLERQPGSELTLERRPSTPLDLLPHMFLSRGESGRDAARFELLSDVATEVPVFRLAADVDVPPAELANLVESCIAAPVAAG